MQSDPDVPTENVVSFADEEAPHSSRDYDQTGLSKKKSKFQVDIRDIVDFVFPSILQHPLAAGRLFAYGLYGPLDERNTLRTGPQGRHEISVWELDSMCKQIEREDVMSIYLHKRGNMGLLSTEEQESLIAQADTHLKKAKGRAMLPQITKEDIYELFKDVPRDKDGYCSFHDIQGIIAEYREARIQNFKLVYPQLTSKKSNSGTMTQTGGSTQLPNLKGSKGSSLGMSRRKKGKVSTAVAPPTMFQRNAGQTNPDIIKQTNSYLSKHAYKICDIDASDESSMTCNVRLLREVEPRCPDPYTDQVTGQSIREKWSDTCNLKGTHMGSMVKTIPSSTTWKRNTTLA